MNSPLRKDMDQDLTTADIAQGNRGENTQAQTEERDASTVARNEPVEITSGQRGQTGTRSTGDSAPLFPDNELGDLRSRWDKIQAGFVDQPRKAVEEADSLVAATMKRLAEVFAQERSKLEGQWDRGDNVSTEDLRVALQRYRSFFQRLLSDLVIPVNPLFRWRTRKSGAPKPAPNTPQLTPVTYRRSPVPRPDTASECAAPMAVVAETPHAARFGTSTPRSRNCQSGDWRGHARWLHAMTC
jgi:hypothetical protein